MCVGSEKSKATSISDKDSSNTMKDENQTAENEDSLSCLLEVAANDDVQEFKHLLEQDASSINRVGLWYSRRMGSRQMFLEQRTPLMVASTYGNLDVIRFMLSQNEIDVNFSCVPDRSTALHCASSGGSVNSIKVVELLLESGADPSALDVNGLRPVDVIVASPKVSSMRSFLEDILQGRSRTIVDSDNIIENILRVSTRNSSSDSPPESSLAENGYPSSPGSLSIPTTSKFEDALPNPVLEKKEYPVDPSIPDIKNSIYATDEFRMYSFKVRPCSRAYSHDWTECPFVHPGENARRRDPRKYHYSCVPCPDFRKGTCKRGDMCEYAHGVFECWLHPAQYRTRLCKDGTSCNRRVCFFAHLPEELRPHYASTGSGVPSPRASASAAMIMDMSSVSSLFPGSPSSVPSMNASPFSQQPMSPSANGISHTRGAWPQPNAPTLNLPGLNFQTSRLRSSLNARDLRPEELNMLADLDIQQQLLNDLSALSRAWLSHLSLNRSGRSKALTPSNLEELFCSELTSSPRFSDQGGPVVYSPTHKSAVLNQFQQQQGHLSPINTNNVFPYNKSDHNTILQGSLCSSPGRMSPRGVEPISPMSARFPAFALRDKQNQMRSLSLRDLGTKLTSSSVVGSPVSSLANWGSPHGKLDWSVERAGYHSGQLRRSSSFEMKNNGEEPDLSWVQSLVKESSPEMEKSDGSVLGGFGPEP